MSRRARERGDKRDRWSGAPEEIPEMSEETRKTFEAISDPVNVHLFTVQAALRVFSWPDLGNSRPSKTFHQRKAERIAQRTQQQPQPR